MHPNDGRVVSNFIVQALQGEDITVYGSGRQTRSFCYVDDLVRGMIALMETPDEVVGPINWTVLDLAALVISMVGSRSKVVHRRLPQDDPQQRRPDISEAGRVLQWKPTVRVEEGLRRTIEYFDGLLGHREPGLIAAAE